MNLQLKKAAALLLLCLGSFLYTTAQTVNTTFATQINNTLSGLDKSKVPNKLLKDQAMEFAELGAYNGTLTADNIVHRGPKPKIISSISNRLLKQTAICQRR
ncbi:hypothetical protein [Aequorivita marina]|uniref:hypothetical protein n=1 Tax=Aequorivita marina TaxID=3073654 RepID=UPI002875E25F|nr:hypothetical protein [Aequorivita sp. S2608]MDS1297513.1 hypothetical protein [Aequorivita sp. S2608]